MEKRLYFVLGDLLVNATAGAVSALLAQAAIASSWHPLAAMPLGLLLGTIASSAVALVFMPLFGAFEVILPALVTGILAGAASPWIPRPVVFGPAIGVAVVAWVYFLTERESGRERRT
jgi:hypothetical protein